MSFAIFDELLSRNGQSFWYLWNRWTLKCCYFSQFWMNSAWWQQSALRNWQQYLCWPYSCYVLDFGKLHQITTRLCSGSKKTPTKNTHNKLEFPIIIKLITKLKILGSEQGNLIRHFRHFELEIKAKTLPNSVIDSSKQI